VLLNAQTSITGAGEVGNAHAQSTMCNGAIIIPPHDIQQPPRWYCRVWEVGKYGIGVVTCCIASIRNFIKILADIVSLLNAYKRTSQLKVKLRLVWLGLLVWLVMRRGSWIMALSSFHLKISCNRHVGDTGCSKLRSMLLE
jgi:hypothetical protein